MTLIVVHFLTLPCHTWTDFDTFADAVLARVVLQTGSLEKRGVSAKRGKA